MLKKIFIGLFIVILLILSSNMFVKTEVDDNETIRVEFMSEPLPYEGDKWWEGMDDDAVIEKLYNSLTFENQYTKEKFKGVKNLKFAYGNENVHGGLVLVENPYDIRIDFNFYANPNHMTSFTEFNAYWNSPDGKYQFPLPSFTVSKPDRVEDEETICKNLGLKPKYTNIADVRMFVGYEEVNDENN